jgi:membrane protein YqaA with SNARE-associated domain
LNHVLAWISVVATGLLELWAAIPLGFTLHLHPVTIAVLSAVGSLLSAIVVIFFGTSLRGWLTRRFQKKNENKESRISGIWRRYGVIGLGFLSPLLTGAPLGAAIGISFGAEPRKLIVWMSVGIIFWSAILTGAVALGVMSLNL